MRIKSAAKGMVFGPGDRISDYADYELRFGGSRSMNGGEGVMVGLTDYFIDDDIGNDGMSDDALIARDRPLAEQFGEELQELLGHEFTVKVYCGHW